jgi:hypothetical protein
VNSTSNGTSTFLLFDDFEEDNLGSKPSKWSVSEETTNAVRVSDNYARSGSKSVRFYSIYGNAESMSKSLSSSQTLYALHYSIRQDVYGSGGNGFGFNHNGGGSQAIWMGT